MSLAGIGTRWAFATGSFKFKIATQVDFAAVEEKIRAHIFSLVNLEGDFEWKTAANSFKFLQFKLSSTSKSSLLLSEV